MPACLISSFLFLINPDRTGPQGPLIMYTDENFTGANCMAQITVSGRDELLELLCRRIAELPYLKGGEYDYSDILKAILEREAQSSTAIGGGLLFPHARIPGLKRLGVVVATLKNPLDLETPDNVPPQIACMLLIPADKPMEGLKFMAHFASFIQMEELRGGLLAAQTSEEMLGRLAHLKKASGKAVLAGDIMTKCSFRLTADMPLTEATKLMAQQRRSIAPVLDGNRLLGQIACSNLFTLGIPDFFSQLKSVGFIRFFDPFEKYFSIEANSTVGQVMSTDCCTFTEEATLIEIVFAISIQKHPQVYVVNRENELLGVIDQALLLERIINL